MSAEEHTRYAPESAAVHVRGVLLTGLGALILLGGAIAALHAIYRDSLAANTMPPPQTFAQPRVDTKDAAELRRILAAQRKTLESWRWANAQHTLIQIPIERAIQLLTQKGDPYAPLLPRQPALSSPASAAQRATTPQTQGASSPPEPQP